MEHLLDNIITPSLNIKVGIKFKGLLEVMEQSEDVMFKSMAQKLGTHAQIIMIDTYSILYSPGIGKSSYTYVRKSMVRCTF